MGNTRQLILIRQGRDGRPSLPPESLWFVVLRGRYHERLCVVLDNFSPLRRKEVRDWCRDNDVELVFTSPTHPG